MAKAKRAPRTTTIYMVDHDGIYFYRKPPTLKTVKGRACWCGQPGCRTQDSVEVVGRRIGQRACSIYNHTKLNPKPLAVYKVTVSLVGKLKKGR